MFGDAESDSEGESAEDRMREEAIKTAVARQRAEIRRQEGAKAREEASPRQRFKPKEEIELRGKIDFREDRLKEKAKPREETTLGVDARMKEKANGGKMSGRQRKPD
jgi:hypothetical protein